MTAGRGIEGAGESDRRIDGDAFPKDDLRLDVAGSGGFIGNGKEAGVPGAEGAGEPTACDEASEVIRHLVPRSGGAGLFEVLRRGGISILLILPCCDRPKWPSLVLSVYTCMDRSEDWVARYSFNGSQATPCT